QLRYDGAKLTVGPREILTRRDLLAGSEYILQNSGMGCAIADGDDLLNAMEARKPSGSGLVCGMGRWQRTRGVWRPAAFDPVTTADDSIEPNLVRDVDGALLMHARSHGKIPLTEAADPGRPVRVWRQAAPDKPWELRIDAQRMVPGTPITI